MATPPKNRMQTVAVAEVLAAGGLGPPGLYVLVPNEQNYTALLMQPQGDIEISGAGIRILRLDTSASTGIGCKGISEGLPKFRRR